MKLLIVDDDAVFRQALCAYLPWDYIGVDSVLVAQNAVTAIEMVKAQDPEIILADIKMPGMDGLELCRELRERGCQARVFIISGYGEFEYARRSMEFGVLDYVLKPLDNDDIDMLIIKLRQAVNDIRKPAEIYSILHPDSDFVQQLANALSHNESNRLRRIPLEIVNKLNLRTLDLVRECFLRILDVVGKIICARGISDNDWKSFHRDIMRNLHSINSVSLIVMYMERALIDAGKAVARINNSMSISWHVREYIDRNYSKADLTISSIADSLYLSPSYVGQVFYREEGQKILDYLRQYRITQSWELLRNTDVSIQDIAEKVGFSSVQYFHRIFRQFTGISPMRYRQAWQTDEKSRDSSGKHG